MDAGFILKMESRMLLWTVYVWTEREKSKMTPTFWLISGTGKTELLFTKMEKTAEEAGFRGECSRHAKLEKSMSHLSKDAENSTRYTMLKLKGKLIKMSFVCCMYVVIMKCPV